MKKTYKKALIISLFLLIGLIVLGYFSETSEKTKKNNENNNGNSRRNSWQDKEFLDLHPDFKVNPNLLKEWVKDCHFVYREIKDWLKIVKPDEADFAYWIVMKKSMQFPADSIERVGYEFPHWLKENNVDINALREEYKEWKKNNP